MEELYINHNAFDCTAQTARGVRREMSIQYQHDASAELQSCRPAEGKEGKDDQRL